MIGKTRFVENIAHMCSLEGSKFVIIALKALRLHGFPQTMTVTHLVTAKELRYFAARIERALVYATKEKIGGK